MSTLCLEDVPEGSQVGLDLHSWQTGPNFRGLRAISDGVHCLHLAINGIVTTKYAAWLDLKGTEVVAYKWDRKAEILVQIDASYAKDTGTINAMFLLEFPDEVDRDWNPLANHLSSTLLRAIVPVGEVVGSTTSSNTDQTASDLSNLGTSTFPEEAEFNFLPIDLKRSWRVGALGREVTEMSLDKSWLLTDSIDRIGGQANFLAFEQWNTMLRLACTSKIAIVPLGSFFASFVALLQVQMQQVSADLFADIFTLTVPRHLNLLKQGMRELSEDTGSNLNAELDENLEVLTQFMSSEFTIDEDHVHLQAVYPTDDTNDDEEDEGDDAPVIVELST